MTGAPARLVSRRRPPPRPPAPDAPARDPAGAPSQRGARPRRPPRRRRHLPCATGCVRARSVAIPSPVAGTGSARRRRPAPPARLRRTPRATSGSPRGARGSDHGGCRWRSSGTIVPSPRSTPRRRRTARGPARRRRARSTRVRSRADRDLRRPPPLPPRRARPDLPRHRRPGCSAVPPPPVRRRTPQRHVSSRPRSRARTTAAPPGCRRSASARPGANDRKPRVRGRLLLTLEQAFRAGQPAAHRRHQRGCPGAGATRREPLRSPPRPVARPLRPACAHAPRPSIVTSRWPAA